MDTLKTSRIDGFHCDWNERKVSHRVLSLGGGVQSTVLALMVSRAKMPKEFREKGYKKPDFAVFADTGWEPRVVYDHLNWLEKEIDLEIFKVHSGNIRANLKKGVTPDGYTFVDVPFYLVNPDGSKGIVRRQCTTHYKLKPIRTFVREQLGVGFRQRFPKDNKVEMWIGISTDEAIRMKPSHEKWVEHKWPLIDIGFSRNDCINWFKENYPNRELPKSACVICPYRSMEGWVEMKSRAPEDFQEAVEFDKYLRSGSKARIPIRRILNGRPYLNSARKPLDRLVSNYARNKTDVVCSEMEQFGNECEGMCGV